MNRSVITEDQITEPMQAIPKADEVEALRNEIEDLKDKLSWLAMICDEQRQALWEIADEKSAFARRPSELRYTAYMALTGELGEQGYAALKAVKAKLVAGFNEEGGA